MADDDNPTLKVMAAAGLSARTVGNHEFDKGWADLAGRVNPAAPGVDQLGANVYLKGTKQVASPLKAYTTFKVGKLDVAVIGAVTGDLPSLVSPAGISDLTIGDPVDALNELKAGVTGDGALCGISNTTTKIDAKAFDTSLPRIREITDIVSAAVTKADEIGAQVIGRASEAISTPTGSSDVRDVESPMSNMVAQMFRELLGGDDPYFIGVQNPGGTRDSFDSGT